MKKEGGEGEIEREREKVDKKGEKRRKKTEGESGSNDFIKLIVKGRSLSFSLSLRVLLLFAYANKARGGVAGLRMNSWIESTVKGGRKVEGREGETGRDETRRETRRDEGWGRKGRGKGRKGKGREGKGRLRPVKRRDERAGCKALKLARFIVARTGLASLDSGLLPLKKGRGGGGHIAGNEQRRGAADLIGDA